MGFQNYCSLQGINPHKYEYRDYHKILGQLDIFEHINEEEYRRINLKDILLNTFLCYLLHTIHQDKFKHIFLLYCQQKFTVGSCKHIFEWNYQHSNQDYRGIREHMSLKNYRPKSWVLLDINSHISMLNYQHMCLEMKDICPKHTFLSYYQPNYLKDSYLNILLCLK